MSQFTEAQMVTVRAAIEFLAETQRAHHGHVADDVQEVYNLFNPVFAEEPAEVTAAAAEAAALEDAEAKPAKSKKAKAAEAAE